VPVDVCIDVDDSSCDGRCVVGIVLAFDDGFDISLGHARRSSRENRLQVVLD